MDSGYRSFASDSNGERMSPSLHHAKSFSFTDHPERSPRNVRRNTVHSRNFGLKMMDEEDFGNDSVHSHGPTMKDQEHMVQDLKKENFDLKLRLYMEQKKNESSDSRIEEYERQIAQLLDRFEEATGEANLLKSDLKETRLREKMLIAKKKRLESQCAEQDEKIHHLSMDLTRIQSSSMQDLSSMRHSTPMRHAKSEFQLAPHHEDDDGDDDDDDETFDDDDDDYSTHDDSKPLSPIHPIKREQSNESNTPDVDTQDVTSGDPQVDKMGRILSVQNITIHQRNDSTRSYNNQYTPVKNFYNFELPDGRPVAATKPRTVGEADNIGIVRPNNSRIGIDANVNACIMDKEEGKKKKKKGFMRIFKMCAGGKSSKVQRNPSMYRRNEFKPRPIPEERPGEVQL